MDEAERINLKSKGVTPAANVFAAAADLLR